MDKWEATTFSDILTIINGRNQHNVENPNGRYPIYGSGGIMGYANDYLCEKDTVIIGRKGTINSPIYVDEPFWNVDTAFGLRPNGSKLLPKYLYYFCERFDFESLNTTVTIPSLTKANLLKIEVLLPPLDVQQKIANILDRAAALIEKRKAQIAKLDLLVKSQFIEMFGDPTTNPKGWTSLKMGDCISLLTDFSANGSYEKLDSNVVMYDEPNYALMIRTTDLEKKDFESDVKYIDENAYELLKKSKLYGNEIIINKIGSAGKVYLMPNLNRPASLGRNAFMLRYKENCNVKFFYYLLISSYGDREIQQHVRGAVTKTITKDAVRSIQVIIPPIEHQNRFADFVRAADKSKFEMRRGLNKLELLYKSLMQKCFQ